jgi:hypothetical protein
MGNFSHNNYFKYSGRYRSRMLRMNRNYSSINKISSIDENNEVNENNSSNNQALLSGNIDIYHKQLGPGLSLVQCNTNDEGSVMIDDDIDSDRYPSWFLLSVNHHHHHNQSQPLTPFKALTSSSSLPLKSYYRDPILKQTSELPLSSSYSSNQRSQRKIYDSPKMILAENMQQQSNRPLSERSPYKSNNSKIRAFSTLRKTMLRQFLIKKEFNNNRKNNDDVYNNHLYYNIDNSSYSNNGNNNSNTVQHNFPIQKEKINFPRYLLKLQQSEKLPSVDILSLPKRVVISSELSINQINTQKEIKVTSSSLDEEKDEFEL